MNLRVARVLSAPGAFRVFLVLVVVLHHSFPIRLGAWAVYVFFILSGYWIARMWRGKYLKTRQPYLTYVASRWMRLAPVFMICITLQVLTKISLNDVNNPYWLNFGWWIRQFLIVGSTAAGGILPPSWSLDVEMQFYLVAPLLILLGNRAPIVATLGGIVSLGYFTAHLLAGGAFDEANLLFYLIYFIAGILIARADWRPSGKLALASLLASGIVVVVLLVLPQTRGAVLARGAGPPPQAGILVGVVLATTALLIVPFVAWNVRQISDSFDRWLGNLAYPIYLFHWIPREFYYALVDWSRPAWINASLLLANGLVAILGGIIILFIDTPLDGLRGRWVKGRLVEAQERQGRS
ncbi:MAG TPA: acyltransferase [Terrimicrobiaceae bacterium]